MLLGRTPLQTFKQRTRVMSLELCDGMLLAAGGSDGEIGINDLNKGLVEVIKGHQGGVMCLMCHNGYLWTGGDDKTINIRGDTYPFPLLQTIADLQGPVTGMAPGTGVVYYTTESTAIHLFSSSSDKNFRREPSLKNIHTSPVTGIRYRSGSLWSASGSTIVRWQADHIPTVITQSLTWSISTFSVTDTLLVIGCENGLIVLATYTGEVVRKFSGHCKAVRSVLFWQLTEASNTANIVGTIFSSSKDGEIKIWNTKDPKPQPETLVLHERNVTSLLLHGCTLFSASTDKKVISWGVSDHIGCPSPMSTSLHRHEEPVLPKQTCCVVS